MKTLSTTILIFLFALTAIGQTYHPLIRPNTFWEVQHGDGSQICQVSGGQQLFYQGDTTIIGLQYKIIRAHPIVSLVPIPYCPPFAVDASTTGIACFMREDTVAKKVYIFNNNTDNLLYDFNLIAGDTLNSFFAGQGSTLIIDSVGTTTLLNGAIRNIFYLNNNEFYIESIGGSQGLCFPLIQGIGFWEVPVCVNENNVSLWGGQCYGTVGVDKVTSNNLFQLFPNPSQDFIQIKSICSKATLTIFDLTGRIILIKQILESSEIIDTREFAADTYIYKFESADKRVVGKFTVIK